MQSSRSKPFLNTVLDLGLRELGVANQPRRLAAHFGGATLPLMALFLVCVVLMCAVVRGTGAGGWAVAAFAVAWPAVAFATLLRSAARSPVVVVKVHADGTNHATRLLMAPFALLSVLAVLSGDLLPLMLPLVALSLVVAVVVWRARGRAPALLRDLRPLLAGERVLGDGLGLAAGRRGRDALRAVVATERRLLVAGPRRPADRFPQVDLPYERVSRFGIEFKHLGRIGVLSLTAAGGETHVVTSVAPPNLLSIGQALRAHGVDTDDGAALDEAQRGWDQVRASGRADAARREATRTRAFDRGLWLLLALVNTLVLSVFERTRELGMLRAVGMTRRQVRRMVRQESVITALIGAAVGLPLGMFLAGLVSNALADEGIGFQVPWGQLVAFTIVAVIAGVLAAIVPARRAAKLNVLRALQYE